MGQSCSCNCSRKQVACGFGQIDFEEDTRHQRIRELPIFRNLGEAEIAEVAKCLQLVRYLPGDTIIKEGEEGLHFFMVDRGRCSAHVQEGGGLREVREFLAGDGFGERALLRDEPRAATVVADEESAIYRLSREDFVEVIRNREHKEELIRQTKLFETMTDDQVRQIGALLQKQKFKAGEVIIRQGDPGQEFYVLDEGECVAEVKSGSSSQEVMRYSPGDLFGEKALLESAPRGATISAQTDVVTFTLTRENFEKEMGPMSQLKAESYLADPRKLIADFYLRGDSRGPRGTLTRKNLQPSGVKSQQTSWFVVYRPCSRDSIAKMLGKVGVGKGLNVKGKSAKKNRLSAFVPFLQISKNAHKTEVESSPSDARTKIFYKSAAARDCAHNAMRIVLKEHSLKIDVPEIKVISQYEPESYGLDVPEPLLREVYIMRPDISPMVGWETGRDSEPAFMDMNLHAVREKSAPQVVLYQFDSADPMNPLGLLIAYAESSVKPVVSDFDTFTVGSRGFTYSGFPEKQLELIHWSLKHTKGLLEKPDARGWTSRWLEILKAEAYKGFHPTIPKFGFGDEVSCSLIDDVVHETEACGAVRHGAECFNFYFPQELDQDGLLIVWEGFEDPPWRSVSEIELRDFLKKRVDDGYTFPFNPVWPIRDKGWYEVIQKLRNTSEGKATLDNWYPEETGILKEIDRIHAQYPEGFKKHETRQSFAANIQDVVGCEVADLAAHEVRRVVQQRWSRIRTAMRMYAKMQSSVSNSRTPSKPKPK